MTAATGECKAAKLLEHAATAGSQDPIVLALVAIGYAILDLRPTPIEIDYVSNFHETARDPEP